MKVLVGAWRWLLALWLCELALAATTRATVSAQVSAALGEFAAPDDHLMYAVSELVGTHPQTIVGIVLALAGSGLLAMLVWSVLAPAVLLRLAHGSMPMTQLGGLWLGSLGGSIATSLWHLLLRAGIAFALGGMLASLPAGLALAIVVAAILLSTAALDISRTQVVLHGAAGGSIRTALWGFVHATKRPRLFGVLALLQALQWACAIAGLAIAVRSGGEAIGWARVAALVGTALGLLRLHHVASAGSMPTPGKRDDPE
ncbi:MAG TPA: hypothetical protein VG755_08965 [Nannocystaceae bacterium]|nr:hypothetical protein [Nannocystaceae bacterium]